MIPKYVLDSILFTNFCYLIKGLQGKNEKKNNFSVKNEQNTFLLKTENSFLFKTKLTKN
jgi:hypothetical protein